MEREELREGGTEKECRKRVQKKVKKVSNLPVLITTNANSTVHTLLLDEQRNGRFMYP